METRRNLGFKLVPARHYSTSLCRRNDKEDWGLEVCGGWEGTGGSWIEVSRVRPGSPAAAAGLRERDNLVSIDGQLVLFSSLEEVLRLFNSSRLTAFIELERPHVRSEIRLGTELRRRDRVRPEPLIRNILREDYSIYSPKYAQSLIAMTKTTYPSC